eukprot:SAG11_NODE_6895_length_1229_cov_2.684071_1_plen_106_part_00
MAAANWAVEATSVEALVAQNAELEREVAALAAAAARSGEGEGEGEGEGVGASMAGGLAASRAEMLAALGLAETDLASPTNGGGRGLAAAAGGRASGRPRLAGRSV